MRERPIDSKPVMSAFLRLSDGTQWSIACLDRPVAPVVKKLISAMQLKRGKGGHYCIFARWSYSAGVKFASENVVFIPDRALMELPEMRNVSEDERNTIDMARLVNALSVSIQSKGAILLHAALAEWGGKGILLAAPSGTGKSTASQRLPAPWRSLSDEACLVLPVKDDFRAHPWPTLSRFYNGGTGGSWNVQESVPLKAVFFLEQSAQDWIEQLRKVDAVIELLKSNGQKNPVNWDDQSDQKRRELRTTIFNTVSDIARDVPVYRLHLSLTGSFWTLLEETLEQF